MGGRRLDFALREIVDADADRITKLIGDWEVARWLSAPPHPYRLADANEFIGRVKDQPNEPGYGERAIVIDNQLCGVIGVDRRSRGGNLGYWLGRPYWGHGVMTRAAAEMTRQFFAKSDEGRLFSGYFSGNLASWAIQRGLGFVTLAEGLLLNRPAGKRLPHIETELTRETFERFAARRAAQGHPT